MTIIVPLPSDFGWEKSWSKKFIVNQSLAKASFKIPSFFLGWHLFHSYLCNPKKQLLLERKG